MIPTREIERALAPERPGAEAFRDDVLRKIAEREAEPARAWQGDPSWPRAASLMPFGWFAPLPRGGALLVLPVLTLAMLALAFASGLRSIARLGRHGREDSEGMQAVIADWWRRHGLLAGITLVSLAGLAWLVPVDALALILVVSMAYVTTILNRLGRERLATRTSIATFCAGFLGMLLVAGAVAGDFARDTRSPYLNEFLPFLVVLAGCLLCGLLADRASKASLPRLLASTAVSLSLLGFLGVRLLVAPSPTTEAGRVEWMEHFDAPLTDTIQWRSASRVGRQLQEKGVDVDLDRAQLRVREFFDSREERAPFLDPGERVVVSYAARLGLVPDGLWERLRSEAAEAGLDQGLEPIRFLEAQALALRALIETGTEAERTRLVSRLLAGWPGPGGVRDLESLATLEELCALAGHPLDLSLRDDAWRILRDHLARRGEVAVGFVSSHQDLAEAGDLHAIHLISPTWKALGLVQRFGVPEGMELEGLSRSLERAASPSLVERLAPRDWRYMTVQPYRYSAAAALEGLGPDRPRGGPPGPVSILLGERVLVGAILLTLLCLLASLGAPRSLPDPARTAPGEPETGDPV